MSFSKMDTKGTKSGKFLKLEKDETVKLQIVSDSPTMVLYHGFGETKENCAGPKCALCHEGSIPIKKWIVEVEVDGKEKQWEFGVMVAKQIKNIAETLESVGKTINEFDLIVKREGSTKENTKYFINYLPRA